MGETLKVLSSPLFLRAVDWHAPVEKNQLEHGAGFLEDLQILGPLLEDLYHHSNLEKLNDHVGKGTKSLEIWYLSIEKCLLFSEHYLFCT